MDGVGLGIGSHQHPLGVHNPKIMINCVFLFSEEPKIQVEEEFYSEAAKKIRANSIKVGEYVAN